MFILPAFISVMMDVCSFIIFGIDPAVSDWQRMREGNLVDFHIRAFPQSIDDIILLAAVRFTLFIPYVVMFAQKRVVKCMILSLTWEWMNIAVLVTKVVYFIINKHDFDGQWLVVIFSGMSCICQMVCIHHLNYWEPPERTELLLQNSSANGTGTQPKFTEMAKQIWEEKWGRLLAGFKKRRPQQHSIFQLVLQLYAHEDVVEQLYRAYDVIDHDEFEFWIPQLSFFLLFGSFRNQYNLRNFLLDKCSRSVVFAHRMHWFLASYCVDMCDNDSVSSLLADVHRAGLLASRELFLESGDENGDGACVGGNYNTFREGEGAGTVAVGSIPRRASLGKLGGYVPPIHSAGAGTGNRSRCSTRGSDASQLAEEEALGSLAPLKSEPESLFFHPIKFVEELVEVCSVLEPTPHDSRTQELRKCLQRIQAAYLPSSILYVPVGLARHRIVGIHPEESFAFSTRERVPYLVCLEVVGSDELQHRSRFPGLAEEPHPNRRWWDPPESLKYSVRLGSKKFTLILADEEAGAGGTGAGAGAGAGAVEGGRSGEVSRRGSRDGAVDVEQGLVEDEESEDRAAVGQWARRGSGDEQDGPRWQFNVTSEAIRRSGSGLIPDGPRASPAPVGGMGGRTPQVAHSVESLATLESFCGDVETALEEGGLLGREESGVDEDKEGVEAPTTGPFVVFKERWEEKENRIRALSPHGHLPGWHLLPMIVKSGDDLRQEQMASQLLTLFSKIFLREKVPVWMRSYEIIATSGDAGLIEAIADTVSLDALRRHLKWYTLRTFFIQHFGAPESNGFKRAREAFVRSMAAYSVMTYLLQVKDRHNGNILLDRNGHIIHIDFGFFLGNSPGGAGFEKVPFKLTADFVELMDGARSPTFRHFRELCVRAFWAARKHREEIILLVEMAASGSGYLPCFDGRPRATIDALKQRFVPGATRLSLVQHVNDLIDTSLDNWRTRWYDKYQRLTVGIF